MLQVAKQTRNGIVLVGYFCCACKVSDKCSTSNVTNVRNNSFLEYIAANSAAAFLN
jgi:hypothetical protein